MTGQAVGRGMPAVQGEFGHPMIKRNGPPALFGMAGHAAPLGRVFFGLSPMGILMACGAGIMRWSEVGRPGMRPRTQGPMAGVARRSLVGSTQRECGFRVLCQGETGGTEAGHGVAVLA